MNALFLCILALSSFFPLAAYSAPHVFLTMLARNKAHVLERYLHCIENLDYEKKDITVYINTNNNTDLTKEILQQWADSFGTQYRQILFEGQDIEDLPSTNPHEWVPKRLRALGAIRNRSLQVAKELDAEYYFVIDCDNFITPCTLKELIRRDKPIIAPMLRSIPEENSLYSNYYCDMQPNGFFKGHPDYTKIYYREMIGTFKVPVVHCTYLIKGEYLDKVSYVDDSDDYEYHIFSRSARNNQIDQYICNERDFGVLTVFFTNVTKQEEEKRLAAYFEKHPLPAQTAITDQNNTVLIAILARNKAHVLPQYLQCIDRLDYDKKNVSIYINTNNNVDNTKELLEAWAQAHKQDFRHIVMESHEILNISETLPQGWTAERLKLLGSIRNKSLQLTKDLGCDYYFTADCDTFLSPCTLKELVSRDLPIVAPMLRSIPEKNDLYSNFFYDITESGYYKDHPDYFRILQREIVGTFLVPVVHHAYLVKAEFIDRLKYVDDTNDYEFIVFSRSARKHGIGQYICNEKEFGTNLHFHDQLTLEEEKRRFEQEL